ncbi:MAG: DNA repair protein RecO [Gammaproteobacteria bacterium]
MSDETEVYLQPAYLLQYHPYRESSLMIEVMTPDFGRIPILAKGARRQQSKSASLIRPFQLLLLSFRGRSEVKVLTHLEASEPAKNLLGTAFYCGFYISELLCHFLHKFDPHPYVFQLYDQSLAQLGKGGNIEQVLRIFEIDLLSEIGYGPQFDYDNWHNQPVSASKKYYYTADTGPIEADNGTISGRTLLALHSKTLNDPNTLAEAKKIMRSTIDFHLQGKPLKSRAVIAKIRHSLII